jgi:hypothetical protein
VTEPVAPGPDPRKRHGVHYTPPELAAFLADRVAIALERSGEPPWAWPEPVRVLDPACGDGALLAAAGARLRARGHRRVELVGLDRDPTAVAAAHLRLTELPDDGTCTVALRVSDALAAAPGSSDAGYHVVITNPPYVRTQLLGAAAAADLARRFGLRGRVDLLHVFVALAGELLADGGVLGLLGSNRFVSTQAGRNVRRLLAERFGVREVYDLGDSKPFPAAVLPAIVIATAGATKPGAAEARYVSVYQRPDPAGPSEHPVPGDPQVPGEQPVPAEAPVPAEQHWSAGRADTSDRRFYADLCADQDTVTHRGGREFAVSVGTLAVQPDPEHHWRLRSASSSRWAATLRRGTWRTFGEVARIRVGIKTTADPVFVRDDWHRLPLEHRPEEQLLLPLLTHRTVRAWRGPESPAARVLYPYDREHPERRTVDLSQFPRAHAYLARHRERLAGRRYVAEAGRQWFEIWVPQRPAGWQAPKIVFPDISVAPRFSVDRSGAVVNGDCYWISFAELPSDELGYLLVGVANSTLAVRYYDLMCANRLYSGRRRWMTQYVSRLPLPDPDSAVANELIGYTKKLCEAAEEPDLELVRYLDELVHNAFREDRF